MNRRTSILDRAVVAATGIVLLAAAGLTAAWAAGAEWARDLLTRFDRSALDTAPDQDWWPTLLGAVAVIAFLAGLILLVANLRRARPETMPIRSADGAVADLSVDLGPLAFGLAAELESLEGVRSVRAVAVDERGLATLRITVTADPAIDVTTFSRSADTLARSMAAALPGAPVATQVLLHLDPPAQGESSQS